MFDPLTEILSQVSLVSKDSSMLDGLDNASIEMEEAKVCNVHGLYCPSTVHQKKILSFYIIGIAIVMIN